MRHKPRSTTVDDWSVTLVQYGIVDECNYSMRLFFADLSVFNDYIA